MLTVKETNKWNYWNHCSKNEGHYNYQQTFKFYFMGKHDKGSTL